MEDTLDTLAEEAIQIIISAEHAVDVIEANRAALQMLLAKASDIPATAEQAASKVEMLSIWRTSIAQLDRAIAVLRGQQ